MSQIHQKYNEQLLSIAKKEIETHGNMISTKNQELIIKQKISLGMSPYEAQLAAGNYAFKVEADPNIWPPNSDPYAVIKRQVNHPDKSKIWLTFENTTQYPESGNTKFTVYFENGCVISIKKMVATDDK